MPIGLFDVIINGLQWAADTFKSEKLEDAAEFGRIGRYYAVEDMLTTEASEKYGRITLREQPAVRQQRYVVAFLSRAWGFGILFQRCSLPCGSVFFSRWYPRVRAC